MGKRKEKREKAEEQGGERPAFVSYVFSGPMLSRGLQATDRCRGDLRAVRTLKGPAQGCPRSDLAPRQTRTRVGRRSAVFDPEAQTRRETPTATNARLVRSLKAAAHDVMG